MKRIYARNRNLLFSFRSCSSCSSFAVFAKQTTPLSKQDGSASTDGSALVVESNCANQNCSQKQSVWRSQPLMPGSKVNAGDFFQSFSILVSGGSPAKVLRMFQHMGLASISESTFYRHQRVCTSRSPDFPPSNNYFGLLQFSQV